MSDNPFATPPNPETKSFSAGGAAPVPQSAPGALITILVFCLIFGIFGLLGTCIGGGSLLAMPALEKIIDEALPDDQKIFNRINMDAQKAIVVPSIVMMVINLVVATMLIIGSIGCFKRKEASRRFLRMALLAAIFYSILKVVLTVYAYLATNAAIQIGVEKLKDDPSYQEVQNQVTSNQVITMITLIVGVVMALAIMAFYVWARGYLGKSHVEKHFAEI